VRRLLAFVAEEVVDVGVVAEAPGVTAVTLRQLI